MEFRRAQHSYGVGLGLELRSILVSDCLGTPTLHCYKILLKCKSFLLLHFEMQRKVFKIIKSFNIYFYLH